MSAISATPASATPESASLIKAGEITETGLVISGGTSFERWEAIGQRLGVCARGHQWAIGDWLRWGHALFGERSSQAIEATGLEESTLRSYLYTAERIEPHRRRRGLSFSHHTLVAGLLPADQEVWLTRALAGNGGQSWSVSEMRIAMQTARHGTPTPRSNQSQASSTRAAGHSGDGGLQGAGMQAVNPLEQAKRAWLSMNESQRISFREWLALGGR